MMKEPDRYAIDKNRLDEECERQPVMYRRAALLLADAERDLAQAKQLFELAEAELLLKIRRDPHVYIGDCKDNESTIKAAVVVQPEYQQQYKAVIEAEHAVKVLAGEVRHLDHRKNGLSDLVKLHLAGYFASPEMPKENRERVDKAGRDRVFGGRKSR